MTDILVQMLLARTLKALDAQKQWVPKNTQEEARVIVDVGDKVFEITIKKIVGPFEDHVNTEEMT